MTTTTWLPAIYLAKFVWIKFPKTYETTAGWQSWHTHTGLAHLHDRIIVDQTFIRRWLTGWLVGWLAFNIIISKVNHLNFVEVFRFSRLALALPLKCCYYCLFCGRTTNGLILPSINIRSIVVQRWDRPQGRHVEFEIVNEMSAWGQSNSTQRWWVMSTAVVGRCRAMSDPEVPPGRCCIRLIFIRVRRLYFAIRLQ